MGGACSTHERDEQFIQFCLENMKGRDQVEDLLMFVCVHACVRACAP